MTSRRLALLAVAGLVLAGFGATSLPGVPARAQAARAQAARAQAAPALSAPCPWVGSAVPVPAKVDEVLAQMTLAEKLSMIHGSSASDGYAGYVPAIPRLCVPALKLEDNASGVGDGLSNITALPDGEADAATWNQALMTQYGQVVGQEQRAKGTNVVLGPMINVMRDPRWGRNYETFSEDPYLTSVAGNADVTGIQSQGLIATVKHIGAYTQEFARTQVNSVVSQRALEEIYLAPFQSAVQQAGAGAIMAAADYTNGVYDNEDPFLLTQSAKTGWQFPGFVMSDWDGAHSVNAITGGLDLSMPVAGNYGAPLQAAVQNGTVSLAYVNDHVARILTEMFAHGLFEHPDTGTPGTPATTPAHVAFATQAAEQSTVLLKNSGPLLPLDASKQRSIAVIGAAGGTAPKAVGCGSGAVSPSHVVSPLQGIQDRAGPASVGYADGSDVQAAAQLASTSDVAVVFANDTECEQGGAPYDDRTSLDIGGNQDQLISAVAAANPHTIVVLDTGSPVTAPWLGQVPAVLEAWYPGQQDGTAIAAVLFGDADPSGRLPQTWPASQSQMPTSSPQAWGNAQTDVFSEGIDVGYRWYQAHNVTPLFPFGYGLSYTTFAFGHEQVTPAGRPGGTTVRVSATVTNTGSRTGWEVAQLYVGDPASTGEPPKQLEGFRKVQLRPGQSAQVSFTLDSSNLRYWDSSAGAWSVAPGPYHLMIGGSSADTPLGATYTVGATTGARTVTVSAPQKIGAGRPATVTTTLTAGGTAPLHGVRMSLDLPAGWRAVAVGRNVSGSVAPGQPEVTTWRVTAPASDSARLEQVTGRARFTAGSGPQTLSGSQQVEVPEIVTGQFSPDTMLVTPGTASTASLRLTNSAGVATTTVWSVQPPDGVTITPASGAVQLAPGASQMVPLTVNAAKGGLNGTADVSLTTTAAGSAAPDHGDALLTVQTAYASLAQAFNNTGITDDANPSPGNIDGSGYSFSAQALAAAGITPGAAISHDGATFTWPDAAAGQPDNVQVAGQPIAVSGSGSHLAFLIAGTHGNTTGTGTITYTDGTTQPFTLVTTDWAYGTPVSGDDLLATTAHWNPNGPGAHQVSVYGTTVPIDPARTVAEVTLPSALSGGDGSGQQTAHVFAVAIAK